MSWLDGEAAVNFDSMVPGSLRDGIKAYVEEGRETGGFLMSVFEGDLFRAAQRADHMNRIMLADIAKFLIWHAPSASIGSREKVTAWMQQGGLTHRTSTTVEADTTAVDGTA